MANDASRAGSPLPRSSFSLASWPPPATFWMSPAGVIFRRKAEPGRHRPFRVPGVPFTPMISIVAAEVHEAVEPEVADDVDAYLHSLLHRNDLVFRLEKHRWLVVLVADEIDLSKFHDKAAIALDEVNRNRIRGPLPEVNLDTAGAWRLPENTEELLGQLREWVETPGAIHA